MAKLVSKVYGDALFSAVREGASDPAQEKECVKRLYEDILALKQVFLENPDFLEILGHPDIPTEEKYALLERVFGGKLEENLYGLLKLLIEKEHIGQVESVLDYVITLYKDYMGIGVVYVTTPMELGAAQKREIEEKILKTTEFKTLEMNYAVDPDIIGGIVIRIGDRVVDASVATRLDKMTRQLKNIQIS